MSRSMEKVWTLAVDTVIEPSSSETCSLASLCSADSLAGDLRVFVSNRTVQACEHSRFSTHVKSRFRLVLQL